jgi:hypothetical protein
MFQARDGDLGRIEIAGIRPEADRGAGIGLADCADDFELAALVAARETLVVFLAAAANPDFQVFDSALTTDTPTPCRPPEYW